MCNLLGMTFLVVFATANAQLFNSYANERAYLPPSGYPKPPQPSVNIFQPHDAPPPYSPFKTPVVPVVPAYNPFKTPAVPSVPPYRPYKSPSVTVVPTVPAYQHHPISTLPPFKPFKPQESVPYSVVFPTAKHDYDLIGTHTCAGCRVPNLKF